MDSLIFDSIVNKKSIRLENVKYEVKADDSNLITKDYGSLIIYNTDDILFKNVKGIHELFIYNDDHDTELTNLKLDKIKMASKLDGKILQGGNINIDNINGNIDLKDIEYSYKKINRYIGLNISINGITGEVTLDMIKEL